MSDHGLRDALLQQLTILLDGGDAHVRFDDAVAGLTPQQQGMVPPGLPYSPWQLLEHLRIAQSDIVDFSSNADGSYKSLAWPADYWPAAAAPPDQGAWQRTLDAIRNDRKRFGSLLALGDLIAPFPWGDGQTLLREALLVADHNSYHLGELVAVRRLLGAWPAA